MAKQVRVINSGDKLQTTRDVYLDEKLIPTGTIFYAYSGNQDGQIRPQVISGFGPNLTITIAVKCPDLNKIMGNPLGNWRYICLPLDCLQLVEK